MPDSNSEGLISLKKRLVSRKHRDLQIEFEKFLNQSLELTACVTFFSAHEGLISVKKRLICRKYETLQMQFEQLLKQILE